MKAVGLFSFGGPEVLRVVDRDAPHAGPGEVRIRVRAAAISPADTLIRRGAAPLRFQGSEPIIPGLDVAGAIDEVGAGSDVGLSVGDRVVALVNPTLRYGGGYAEQVVLPGSWVVPAPAGADDAEAATLPLNGLTALRALDQLDLPAGSTLAVTGAAGAVGGFAVQLAKVAGHRVLADASPTDAQLVAALGADVVVPRGSGVAEKFRAHAPDGVDAVVDAAVIGAPLLRAIRKGGRLAFVRGVAGQRAFEKAAERHGVRLFATFVHDYDGRSDKLGLLCRLAGEGRLTLRVAGRFPPEEAAHAHRLLEAGGVRGRLILEF
ncbi:NADP-dependent oxidoreductase [Streptomyces sp. NPDC004562]|uniref:NADP-dependent oxidoreductase n=1 Tax=Streptomyces sp. NPDC004562 TaxID=3364703 RepID=UPI0036A10434